MGAEVVLRPVVPDVCALNERSESPITTVISTGASPTGTLINIRVLGPLEVTAAGGPVPIAGRKQRAVLGLLALRAGEVVGVGRLVDALWGDAPPLTAVRTLHSHVAHLRRALAGSGARGIIETRDPGYRLRIRREQVDAYQFDELVTSGRGALARKEASRAIVRLRMGLDMWRGEPLVDCGPGEWVRAEATRLEETRMTATETLLEAELAVGNHAEVAAELERLVSWYPLRERLWGLLMVALYHQGRQADALRAYDRARRALLEVGLNPGPDLRQLEATILQHDVTCSPGRGRSIEGVRHNAWPVLKQATPHPLPVPLTSLVGRARELEEVIAAVEATRLVTITGMGGCGKTRLAIAAADHVQRLGRSAVAFVDLAPVSDPAVVALAVADAVGACEERNATLLEAVAFSVGGGDLLLVLDNCEHLVETCAHTVQFLLSSCPRLRVLATSRESLGVPGETAWSLHPLPVPDVAEATSVQAVARFAAVTLFLERAAGARAGFMVRDSEARSVARICASLDGLPLAIELAAARTNVLGVEQIAARLGDRFGLLAGSSRARRPQHQELRATVDWSYGLLTQQEQAFLRALSVFAGGFTLEAAEAVSEGSEDDPVLSLLTSLVRKSLVQMEPRPSRTRYRLLETIRDFAREKLLGRTGEAEVAFGRHAAFFQLLAERLAPQLQGSDLEAALDDLKSEHDNLREALARFARCGDGTEELALAAALARYCYLRGHYREGRRWLEEARGRAQQPPPAVLARALHGEGMLAFYECDYDHAQARCRESLELHRHLGHDEGVARCLTTLGSVARERGAYASSVALHRESLGIFWRIGDRWGVAHSLQMSGFASWLEGSFEEAAASSGESLDLFRDLGDKERIGWALLDLAAVAHYCGDQARARYLLDEALRLFEAVEFKEGVAWALNLLALTEQACEDHERGRTLLIRSAILHGELRDRWRLASVLEAIARSASATGDFLQAAAVLGAAAAIRDDIGAPVPPCELEVLKDTRASVCAHVGPQALVDAVVAGRSATLAEVVQLAAGQRGEPPMPRSPTAPPGSGWKPDADRRTSRKNG